MVRNAQIIRYDPRQFNFAEILESSVFRIRPLDQLHVYWRQHKAQTRGSDAIGYPDNLALRKLMQDLPDHSPFIVAYHRFMRTVIAPHFGGKISYSNRPKMRVHLAGTPSVSSWHRDADITRRPDQINVFLPFTRCQGTSALWCESDYGLKDYHAVDLEVGDVLLFDGGYLEHGSVPNETATTRCSLDTRFAITGGTVAPPWSLILSGRPAELGGDPLATRAGAEAGQACGTTAPVASETEQM